MTPVLPDLALDRYAEIWRANPRLRAVALDVFLCAPDMHLASLLAPAPADDDDVPRPLLPAQSLARWICQQPKRTARSVLAAPPTRLRELARLDPDELAALEAEPHPTVTETAERIRRTYEHYRRRCCDLTYGDVEAWLEALRGRRPRWPLNTPANVRDRLELAEIRGGGVRLSRRDLRLVCKSDAA